MAAREAAKTDRNGESARLFSRAIAEDPSMRLSLLPEFSDQLTYSGHSGQAIGLYEEVLAARPGDGSERRHLQLGLALALSWNHQLSRSLSVYRALVRANPLDVEATLGEARVLSWQDQLSASLRTYRHVLVLDPANLDARRNIVRVESWRGRQRTAERLARTFLEAHVNDETVEATLGQSEIWLGRTDVASHIDRSILDRSASDISGVNLASAIRKAERPDFNFSQSVGTQSDGLLIRTADLEGDFHTASGLQSIGFRYQPISYTGQNGAGNAEERRIGFFAQRRFSDWSELHVAAANDEITADGGPTSNVLLFNAYATFWASDSLRFDAGARKETFDNLTSLRMGITGTFASFSTDFTPDENDRFSLRGDIGSFSDGNRRQFQQVEFERVVDRKPRLSFGVRGTDYSFAAQMNHGYFDPPRYNSAEATSHLYGDVANRFTYDAGATYGREWVTDGGTRPTHSIDATFAYPIVHPLSLAAYVNSFDTRQEISNSGFARTTVGIRITSAW